MVGHLAGDYIIFYPWHFDLPHFQSSQKVVLCSVHCSCNLMPTSPLCIVTVSNVAVTWIQLPAPAQLTITLYIYWDTASCQGEEWRSCTAQLDPALIQRHNASNLDIYTQTRKLPHLDHPSAGDAWEAVPCPDTAVLQCCSNVVTQLSSCSPHAVTAEHPQLHILMVTLAPTGD